MIPDDEGFVFKPHGAPVVLYIDNEVEILDSDWKLFPGATIKHFYGNLWILDHETRTDGFPTLVVQSGTNEPIAPSLMSLTPNELRAIAEWKESLIVGESGESWGN